jgi:hypothetical protein
MGAERIFEVDNIHRDVETLLTGNVIGEDNKKRPVVDSALINEKGVVLVMSIIKSHVNKNIYLSDIDNDFINQKCVDIFYDLYINLIEDMDTYNIRSIEHISLICETIDTCIYTSLRRALLGAERKKYYDSMTEKYNHSDTGNLGGLNLGR